jgi:hypothetical protein
MARRRHVGCREKRFGPLRVCSPRLMKRLRQVPLRRDEKRKRPHYPAGWGVVHLPKRKILTLKPGGRPLAQTFRPAAEAAATRSQGKPQASAWRLKNLFRGISRWALAHGLAVLRSHHAPRDESEAANQASSRFAVAQKGILAPPPLTARGASGLRARHLLPECGLRRRRTWSAGLQYSLASQWHSIQSPSARATRDRASALFRHYRAPIAGTTTGETRRPGRRGNRRLAPGG